MRELSFSVYGTPQTAGSKIAIQSKAMKRPVVVESGDRKAKTAWRQDVRAVAADAISGAEGWSFDGPMAVEFVFLRRRPKTHYGRRSGLPYLKDSASSYPIARPDLLKAARALEDALTGLVWVDDAQIVEERLLKVWHEREGVEVRVRQLEAVGASLPLQTTL